MDLPLFVPIYTELKSPVTAQIELTDLCNNQCIYCYNSCRGEQRDVQSKGLSLIEFSKIARQLVENEVFEVVLTGGEPLLRKDLLYPLARYFTEEKVDVKLNTNLTLLNEIDVKKMRDSGILSVFGSLSSFDESMYNLITQTNGFNLAVRGIEFLVKNSLPVGINMVVIQRNKNQVYETGKFLNNLGVKIFCATPASPCQYLKLGDELRAEEIVHTLDDLLRLKEEFGMNVDIVEPIPRCVIKDPSKYEHFLRRDCAAGKLTVAISPNGDVRPCTHVPISYGNLLEEKLFEVWRKMNEWRSGKYVPKDCYPCKELENCSLGCREAAKIRKGSYELQDPWSREAIESDRRSIDESKTDPNEKMSIPKNIKFRREEDGYLIFSSNSHSIAYINPKFFQALSYLASKGTFSQKQLEIETGNDFSSMIKYLKPRGFIKTW